MQLQQEQPVALGGYTSSLLNSGGVAGGPNKFNTIHSSINKNKGIGGAGSTNHYESATGGVVGGSGLKDYTRIGEGGAALLALREREFLQQQSPFNGGQVMPSGAGQIPKGMMYLPNHNNAAYHLSTLGRSGNVRTGPFVNLKGVDPSLVNPLLMNASSVAGDKNGTHASSVAASTSVGGSTSSSSGTGANSLLNSANEEGGIGGTNSSLRLSGGKKHFGSNQKGSNNPMLPDSAYGTNRSTKKAYL